MIIEDSILKLYFHQVSPYSKPFFQVSIVDLFCGQASYLLIVPAIIFLHLRMVVLLNRVNASLGDLPTEEKVRRKSISLVFPH